MIGDNSQKTAIILNDFTPGKAKDSHVMSKTLGSLPGDSPMGFTIHSALLRTSFQFLRALLVLRGYAESAFIGGFNFTSMVLIRGDVV